MGRTAPRSLWLCSPITGHTMPGIEQLESVSPFCMKVEVYLKLQQLRYKIATGDPRKAPKGNFA